MRAYRLILVSASRYRLFFRQPAAQQLHLPLKVRFKLIIRHQHLTASETPLPML